MHGLRHGMIAAGVQRGREPDTAGKARYLIREDVAKQVRGGDKTKFLMSTREGRTERIHPHRIERDRRIFGTELLKGADEQSFEVLKEVLRLVEGASGWHATATGSSTPR